jgi:hypothetical protein
MRPRLGLVLIAACALGAGVLAFYRRPAGRTPRVPLARPSTETAAVVMPPSGDVAVPPPPRPPDATPTPKPPEPAPPPVPAYVEADPALAEWRRAIVTFNRDQCLYMEGALHDEQERLRDVLMKLAVEDPDPRVRAFTLSVLGRFRLHPPEDWFIARLGDPHEYPRRSAAAALGRHGSASSLPLLEKMASSDPAELARKDAAEAAKLLREK